MAEAPAQRQMDICATGLAVCACAARGVCEELGCEGTIATVAPVKGQVSGEGVGENQACECLASAEQGYAVCAAEVSAHEKDLESIRTCRGSDRADGGRGCLGIQSVRITDEALPLHRFPGPLRGMRPMEPGAGCLNAYAYLGALGWGHPWRVTPPVECSSSQKQVRYARRPPQGRECAHNTQ